MTPGQMENRTCRKNKNTPQTLQKVYIPRWSSKQKKQAEKTGFKSTKIRDLWGLTDNAHTRELSCPFPFVPWLMLSCNISPHPSNMPLLFLFLPARKGKMTGLRKLREEESYRLLTTFKRKFVQWNLWAMGIIFRVLPDLQDGKRWWKTTKKKKSRREEAAGLLGRTEREERKKRSLGERGRVVSK